MPTLADIDWYRLETEFGPCASELRDSVRTGRSYRASELAEEVGCDEAAAKGLLEEVASHGLLTKQSIWVCRQSDDVIDEPDRADTECPECGQPYAGKRPVEEVQYQVVAPPRRTVPAMLAVHGMNTRGAWQESLGLLLSSMHGRSIPMAVYKYGLIVTGVIMRWRQKQLTEKMITQLKLVSAGLGDRPFGNRPDVIAHSFGTWLLYNALKSDETLRVGHVILTGCVLPPDTRWDVLGDRVGPVLNHYGGKDPWTRIAAYAIPASGPSGRRGFNEQPGLVQVVEPEFGHSDFFLEKNLDDVFERVWRPFLTSPASDIGNLPSIFAPKHPADTSDWKKVPGFFRAGIVRWLALLLLVLVGPVALAAALPVSAWLIALALPVALALGVVILLGMWRGWDR